MASILREQAKLKWPPTEEEFIELLDGVVFTDEVFTLGVKRYRLTTVPTQTVYADIAELADAEILFVKQVPGQGFVADDEYTLDGTTLTLTTPPEEEFELLFIYV